MLLNKFKNKLINEKKIAFTYLNTTKNHKFFKEYFNKKQLVKIALFKKKTRYNKIISQENILFYKNGNIIIKKNDKQLLKKYFLNLIKNEFKNLYSEKQLNFIKYLQENKIHQLSLDISLEKFNRIYKRFNLKKYNDPNKPCLFFGYYTDEQLEKIYNHNSKKYIMFGGSDVSFKIEDGLPDTTFISISKNIHDRLNFLNIKNILLELDLVDYRLFTKIRNKGPSIFVYDMPFDYNKDHTDGFNNRYNCPLIKEIMNRLPQYNFILNSKLYNKYEDMPNIYKKCFIGLRLTNSDGNANMVQELEAMNIPVVHNWSEYGLKWTKIKDIINYINIYYQFLVNINFNIFNSDKINFDRNIHIHKKLDNIWNNIDYFTLLLKQYKNILFISAGYPGYGGAATNCHNLAEFYKKSHNIKEIFWTYNVDYTSNKNIIREKNLEKKLRKIKFKPDLIILKSALNINIRKIFNCPIVFLIPGIFKNSLNKDYWKLSNKGELYKNINKTVINQIKNSHISFCNSYHTQIILSKLFKLKTYLFYSSFINHYRKEITLIRPFKKRKYDYGLIVSDFSRPIKNIKKSIEFLKTKKDKKIILIGKGSKMFHNKGWKTVGLVDYNNMSKYYQDIKYIIQDSHYESCSNVAIEAMFNGCERHYNIIVSSTQYPGYGGAATNAYQLIKYLRSIGNNVCGVFFHNDINVNYNPDELEGIFLFREPNKFINRVCCEYLDGRPDFCMAKNYLAPIYCKKIFNCHTIYLVSGINHFNMFYPQISAQMMLNHNFIIDKRIKEELFCNHLADEIIVNSKLTKKLFEKIYPMFKDKITSVVDTSFLNKKINIKPKKEKEYDIVICASNWKRPVKNALFLVKLFSDERMNKYKKVVIGENYQPFAFFPNTTCKGLLERKECLEIMNNCKIILCPSLFDSNPAVLAEANKLGCEAILTKNVGSYDKYDKGSICNSFLIEEWIKKIENKIKE